MWWRQRSLGAWFTLLLWLLRQLWLAGTADPFCDDQNVPDTGILHIARLTNEIEPKKLSSAVQLRCCAKHYDEILWFRENEATQEWMRLPNPLHTSLDHLIDDNRTLMSLSTQKRDSGLFFCVARNNSEGRNITLSRRLIVEVDAPLNETVLEDTYEERIQRIGDRTKIKCSMISKTKVVWFRDDGVYQTFPFLSKDHKVLPNVHVAPIKTLNETNHLKYTEVNGQAMIIDPIQAENFGRYFCYCNKRIVRTVILTEGGYRRELKVTVICLLTLFVILAVLGPSCWYWRIELCLFWKDRFGKLEENDDKIYDIFVSYDKEDAYFVLQILVPVLEDHFRYRCFAWERDSIAGGWIPEILVQSIGDSRRFLMILSPALLENRWCMFALHVALKAVLQLQLHIICVKLHDVDWSQVQLADKTANETLRQVLHVVRTVEWEPNEKSRALSNQQIVTVKDKSLLNFNKFIKRKNNISEEDIETPGRPRFWRKLRLYLPPRRTLPLVLKQPSSPTSTKSLLSLPQSDCC